MKKESKLNSITVIRKNIFACLFSAHNAISLSCYEQVCLIRLRFERYFSNHRATKLSWLDKPIVLWTLNRQVKYFYVQVKTIYRTIKSD